MKHSELKQIIKEEVRKVLIESSLDYFKPYGKEHEDVYKELNFDDKNNLELVFIYFRGLKNDKKAKFIPKIIRSNSKSGENEYDKQHVIDYVDTETGEVFSITVLDEDWFEDVHRIYPENEESLEIMKRENLV
jgi:hypothetical protein